MCISRMYVGQLGTIMLCGGGGKGKSVANSKVVLWSAINYPPINNILLGFPSSWLVVPEGGSQLIISETFAGHAAPA